MTRRERSAARCPIRPFRLIAAGRMWLAALMVPLCLASPSYSQTTYQVVKGFDAPYLDATVPFNLMPDTELNEHLCENEKDLVNMYRK